MANAETIEIDEDDDILGIMDTLPGDYGVLSADHDDEVILETGPAAEIESEPEPETVRETEVSEESLPVTAEEPQPIKVTAKESIETSEAKAAGSDFSVYIMILLAAIVLGALYYFLMVKK